MKPFLATSFFVIFFLIQDLNLVSSAPFICLGIFIYKENHFFSDRSKVLAAPFKNAAHSTII